MMSCRLCLASNLMLFKMTSQEMNVHANLVKKIKELNRKLYICIYCKYLLKKTNRFINQCRRSEEIIAGIIEDSNRNVQPTLLKSETKYHYIGPSVELQEEIKVEDDSDHQNEDIPLVLLRNDNNICKEFKDQDETDQLPLPKKDKKEKLRKTTKNHMKGNKDGFTSRMVRETEEYVVIKLTKEQVLKELQKNLESDKYTMAPYKCENCVKGFNFEDVLESHLEKHSPKNGPLQCELCTQYCPSVVSLRGHMKSHTTRYKCKVCGLIRLSRQHVLEHHSLEHTASTAAYCCSQCDYSTNKRTVMQRHVRVHSANESYSCHQCGKLYKSRESLRVHTMRHDKSKRHKCEICNRCFIYAKQLTTHMESVHVRRDYYCVECDIMFKSMDTLKQHFQRAKRHRNSSSYKYNCPQCDQRFISPSTLATHQTAVHGAPKRETCGICARAYSSGEALRLHLRRSHSNTQTPRIPCQVCDRSFSRKTVAIMHMRTHTGERPHACECGAAFTQPAALRAHRAAKHQKEENSQLKLNNKK